MGKGILCIATIDQVFVEQKIDLTSKVSAASRKYIYQSNWSSYRERSVVVYVLYKSIRPKCLGWISARVSFLHRVENGIFSELWGTPKDVNGIRMNRK